MKKKYLVLFGPQINRRWAIGSLNDKQTRLTTEEVFWVRADGQAEIRRAEYPVTAHDRIIYLNPGKDYDVRIAMHDMGTSASPGWSIKAGDLVLFSHLTRIQAEILEPILKDEING